MPILGIIASSKLTAVSSAFEFIARTEINSTQSSITFSSISTSYQHLLILGSVAPNPANEVTTIFTWNSQTGNRSAIYIGSSGSGAFAHDAVWLVDYSGGNGSNIFGSFEHYVPSYSNTTYTKSGVSIGVVESTSSHAPASLGYQQLERTGALTSLVLTGTSSQSFISGTSYAIYGLKNS